LNGASCSGSRAAGGSASGGCEALGSVASATFPPGPHFHLHDEQTHHRCQREHGQHGARQCARGRWAGVYARTSLGHASGRACMHVKWAGTHVRARTHTARARSKPTLPSPGRAVPFLPGMSYGNPARRRFPKSHIFEFKVGVGRSLAVMGAEVRAAPCARGMPGARATQVGLAARYATPPPAVLIGHRPKRHAPLPWLSAALKQRARRHHV
jgi:hypothetical protein